MSAEKQSGWSFSVDPTSLFAQFASHEGGK